MLNRSHINRCLAKAIAYKQCGQDVAAANWARELISALELAAILSPVVSTKEG